MTSVGCDNFEFPESAQEHDDIFDYSPYLRQKYSNDPKVWASQLLEIPYVWQDMRRQLEAIRESNYCYDIWYQTGSTKWSSFDISCEEYVTFVERVAEDATAIALKDRTQLQMDNIRYIVHEFRYLYPELQDFIKSFGSSMTTKQSLVWIQFKIESCLMNQIDRLGHAEDGLEMKEFVTSRDIASCLIHPRLLHIPIYTTNFEMFKYLFTFPAIDVNCRDHEGFTVLHQAVREYWMDLTYDRRSHRDSAYLVNMIKYLLDLKGVDLDVNDIKLHADTILDNAVGKVLELLVADPRADAYIISTRLLRKFLQFGKVEELRTILKHPEINLNLTQDRYPDFTFYPALFYIHGDHTTVTPSPLHAYKVFLEDERVKLSIRAYLMRHPYLEFNIKDRIDCDDRSTYAYSEEVASVIHDAEILRLQWAKQRVRILKEWVVGPLEKTIDENVLSTYVLPYVADIVSPIEDLGGGDL